MPPASGPAWRGLSRRSDYPRRRAAGFRGFVAGGAPVAVREGRTVDGLHPRTGRVRWSHPSTKYAFTDGRRVYAPAGGTITAYDPRSGAARWSVPVPADVEESQTGSGVLVVQTFPTGGAPRFLVLDPARGATRAAIDLPRDHYLTLVGRHLVDAGSGCNARITGYGLDGAVAWGRSLKLGRDRSKRCDAYLAHDAGGDVALNAVAGPALLLDPATGRTLWKGPRGASIDGTAGGPPGRRAARPAAHARSRHRRRPDGVDLPRHHRPVGDVARIRGEQRCSAAASSARSCSTAAPAASSSRCRASRRTSCRERGRG